uniref:Endothelin-converting enzyme 1-like n=1 Tax=Hirondellea gigas TaxID=1518452 RepID=A0A6A7G4A8_9CRUS
MMTEMTRYKQQMDAEDDISSLGSARTEDLSSGPTRVRYHLGSTWWRSRTALEKVLLLGWLLLLLAVIILAASLHVHNKTPHVLVFHNASTYGGIPQVLTDGVGGGGGAGEDTTSTPVVTKDTSELCLTRDCVMVAARVLASMDMSVDPCDDFYRYACGGWVASNPVPDGKASWGTIDKLTSENQIVLRNELESVEKSESKAEEKARMFYRSCLDKDNIIQKKKAKPLLDAMERVGYHEWGEDVSTKYDFPHDIIVSQINMSSGALFSWGVAEDDKHSDTNIVQFTQGGLTLMSRDLYLNETNNTVAEAYVDYLAKIGELLGATKEKAREVAEGIMEVEKRIANFTELPEQQRDVKKLYCKMTLEKLSDLAPFMDWEKFVNAAFYKIGRRVNASTEVVVYARDFLKSISNMVNELKGTPKGISMLHNYLTWQYVQRFVNLLSDDFRDAAKGLAEAQDGVSGEEQTWRQCVAATDAALGPALGAMYVRKAFTQDSKEQVEAMLQRIRKTFRLSLNTVSWMDNKTRKAATEKADAIPEMIGYPDYILDPKELDKKFKELKLSEDDFFDNNLRVAEMQFKEMLRRLFKPVNKTRWDMTPPTVNAYYSPVRNDIVFPAGILQPPLFWSKNPHSLNYGAVGVVMGHELVHAFDDQGRQYNKDGNLDQWWEPETIRRFKEQTKCMVQQYSNYTLGGEHLNGNLTLGENIADNGGLKASFLAYQLMVESSSHQEPDLPGLNVTHDQLFFLGFGQIWCSTMTKERAHQEIKEDPHVPPEFRVKGSLSNFKEFSRVFSCAEGRTMNPKEKCSVW